MTEQAGKSRPRQPRDVVEPDMGKLKGIGPKYAAILKEAGVTSINDLRNRSAASLKQMIETHHGTVVGLSEHECQTWIDEAKAFKFEHPGPTHR